MRRIYGIALFAMALGGVAGCVGTDEEEPLGEAEQRSGLGALGGGIVGGITGYLVEGPSGVLPGIGAGTSLGDAMTGPDKPGPTASPSPASSSSPSSSCSCSCNSGR